MKRKWGYWMVALGMGMACLGGNAEESFPLLAWNTNTEGWSVSPSPEVWRNMAECGITIAGFSRLEDLADIAQAGLRTYVYDPRACSYDWRNFDAETARRQFRELVRETEAYGDTVYGFYLKDEPVADEFSGLAQMIQIVREEAPGKMAYVNLLPNYAPAQIYPDGSYERYLEEFVTQCRPEQLSYDYYGLLESDPTGIRPGFWDNLAQMRDAAQAAGVPFTLILLSNGHLIYRVPNDADMALQIYSALAYGARGIAYFTFAAPKVGNYRNAPLDQFGVKTPLWNIVQYLNRSVINLAPVLNQLDSLRVYHLPEGPLPEGAVITASEGKSLLVGEFKHRATGEVYLLVVNKDLTRSVSLAGLEWQGGGTPELWLQSVWDRGAELNCRGEMAWMGPGQGILVRVAKA